MRVVAILNELNVELISLETEEPNLERVFLHLTGSATCGIAHLFPLAATRGRGVGAEGQMLSSDAIPRLTPTPLPRRVREGLSDLRLRRGMVVWALAKKELRLLLRDRMAVVVLLGMPLVFILLWGLMLGENFGQKNADEKLRVFLVDLDEGEGLSPGVPWSKEVYKDLNETAGIHVDYLTGLDEAERQIRKHKVAAVLVFRPDFSKRINKCSFLADGINPFHRDGVYLDRIDAELLKDPKQLLGRRAPSSTRGVAQVSLQSASSCAVDDRQGVRAAQRPGIHSIAWAKR